MDGLYRWDMTTFRSINVGWHSDLLTPIFWLLSYTGLSQIQILFCLLLYRWPSARRLIVPGTVTIAVTGLAFAQVMKRLVPRDRPSHLNFALPQENFYGNSFPSGHTTTAFALATMIALMSTGPRRGWVAVGAFAWATAVGISRVYRGVHWPTDVLAGACAGTMGSGLIYLVFSAKGGLELPLAKGK